MTVKAPWWRGWWHPPPHAAVVQRGGGVVTWPRGMQLSLVFTGDWWASTTWMAGLTFSQNKDNQMYASRWMATMIEDIDDDIGSANCLKEMLQVKRDTKYLS